MKYALLNLVFWINLAIAHAVVPQTYTNPVNPGFFPDPSTIRVGTNYYTVNSTFEYFPSIVISHSRDLVNWEQIGHVFSKSEDLNLTHFFDGMGIWAPDISYFNGEFYIFYCTVQLSKDRSTNVRGNYMVKSKSILGPWSKPVQITNFGSDPSHFVDDDGEHYMLFAAGIPTGNGTKIVKLTKDCTKMAEEPRWIETEGKKSAPEGPHMLKKDGYYYFIMAASSGLFQGHHMLIARSKNVYGPFDNSPYNPYLTQRDTNAINFHQGHGKIFNTQNGEWWTTVLSQRWIKGYVKGRKTGISPLGRETSLYKITWGADGWPIANDGKGPLDTNVRPNLPWTPVKVASSDAFTSPKLGIQWYWRRNPVYADFSLAEKKGFLRIYTGNFDIDTILGRNLIVQRERWLSFEAVTKLTFNPETYEQAGLVAHYDTKTWARLGLQRDESGKLELLLEECRYGKKAVVRVTPDIQRTTLYLKMKVDKLQRWFYYSYDNSTWFDAGSIADAAFLSDQGTPNWGFMGMMVGVYSFNRGTGKRIPADFDFVHLREVQNPDYDVAKWIQPVPETAKFGLKDYMVWCGSMIQGNDKKYYLFYSRWPRAKGHFAWVTDSEVAVAVSDSPTGPYKHVKVVLPKRDKKYWDADVTHNPTVYKFGNHYYLYYMGTHGTKVFDTKVSTSDPAWWEYRNNQRIGVAVASSPLGPWKRMDKPVIDTTRNNFDHQMCANPAVTQRPDGTILMIYKGVGPGKMPFGGVVLHGAAIAENPLGPFRKLPNRIFVKDSVQFAAEDPFIWYQEGKYWAIVKDFKGSFTNAGLSLALFESPDGLDWKPAKHALVTTTQIPWISGTRAVTKLERPQLWLDKGIPKVLFCAVYDGSDNYNVAIPLKMNE